MINNNDYRKTNILNIVYHLVFVSYLALMIGSSPTVGSSNINKLGSCKRAVHKENLLCCPPLKIISQY